MQGHGGVHLRLGDARLDGDGQRLDDFGGVHADHMDPQHQAGRTLGDDLDHHVFLAPADGVLQGAEARAVDIDLTMPGPGGLFGEADGPHGGLGKDGARDIFMVRRQGAFTVKRLDQAHRLMDRHRREINPVGAIADGEDMGLGRARINIDFDGTVFLEPYPGGLEPEATAIGQASGRHQNLIGGDGVPARQCHRKAVILFGFFRLLDLLDLGVEMKNDALFRHFRVHRVADVFIEPAQHLVAAVDHMHVGAEAAHDAGELERDVTRAHDHQAAGKLVQVEDFVGRDGKRRAFERGHEGAPARRYDNVLRRHGVLAHAYCMGVFQDGVAGEQLDPGIAEDLVIDALEALELLLLGRHQGGPVEGEPLHIPAIGGGVFEVVGEVRGEYVEFFGYAAAMDAGAADGPFLGQRRALAHGARKPGGPHPAGARPYGE